MRVYIYLGECKYDLVNLTDIPYLCKEMYIDINIGDDLIDSDGFCCKVIDIKKTNLGMSVRLYQLKRTDKGINSTQWHWVDRFFKERFKYGLEGYLTFINKASYEEIKTYFRTKKEIFN